MSHLVSPPRACGEMGSGDGDVRGSNGSIDRHSVWDVSVEELHLTIKAQKSAISAHFLAALASMVAENQAGSCALKSPSIRVSSVREKKLVRLGV